ncbi:MAG: hypothetical protein QM656_06490 [Paracoccaceae bacterium]
MSLVSVVAASAAACTLLAPMAFAQGVKIAFIGRGVADGVINGVKDVPIIVGLGKFNSTPARFATFGKGIPTIKDGNFVRPDDL